MTLAFFQLVTQPTRGGNILNLFSTSNQTLVDEIKCSPGLSDHDIVTAIGSLKPTTQKQMARRVHFYSKADWHKLKSLMKDFQVSFLSSHKGKSVEELWKSFISAMGKYMDECIPSKYIRGKSTLPWITQEIKRLIRKRDKIYRSYKKTQDHNK